MLSLSFIIGSLFYLMFFLFPTLIRPARGSLKRLQYLVRFILAFVLLTLPGTFLAILDISFGRLLTSDMAPFFVIATIVISSFSLWWLGRISAQRARDAGVNPRLGIIGIIPLLNLLLLVLPSRPAIARAKLEEVFS